MSSAVPPAGRRYELDWLRVLAIMAVFVFHTLRFFDPGDWHVKNPTTYPGLMPVIAFFGAWMMPLIFVISGAGTFFALSRVRAGRFIGDRALRLLVPLTAGIFTHVAWQIYLDRLTHGRFSGSFLQFLPHYFDGLDAFGGNFAWHGQHMWYLCMLFFFSALFLPLLAWLQRGSGKRVLAGLGAVLSRPGTVYLLALPISLCVVLPAPDTLLGNRSFGGWSILGYMPFFLAGFLLASHAGCYANVRRLRWISLAGGIAATAWLVAQFATLGEPVFGSRHYSLFFAVYGVNSWCWVLAALGFGARYLNRPSTFLLRANELVLPFYVLHQTVLLTIGYFVVRAAVPDLARWAVIAVASFALCVALCEYIIRPSNAVRFLFGMKPVAATIRARPQPVIHEGASS